MWIQWTYDPSEKVGPMILYKLGDHDYDDDDDDNNDDYDNDDYDELRILVNPTESWNEGFEHWSYQDTHDMVFMCIYIYIY